MWWVMVVSIETAEEEEEAAGLEWCYLGITAKPNLPSYPIPIPFHSIPSFDTTKKETFHLPHSSSVLLPILIEKALTT